MKLRRQNEGSVLLVALVLLAVLGVGAAVVWSQLHRSMGAVHDAHKNASVRYLAEAGIEQAIANLRKDTGFSGVQDVALGDGFYSVRVTPLESENTFEVEGHGVLKDGALVLREARVAGRLRLLPGEGGTGYAWEVGG